jgi:hypothetical protein
MVRAVSCVAVTLALLAGCSTGGGSAAGGSKGFPEKGLAAVADKVKKGDDILDHALLQKAHAVPEATSEQIHKTWKKIAQVEVVTDEEKAAMEAAVKAAGFADVKEFLKAYAALGDVEMALSAMRRLESGNANDFQKAMAADFVKKTTEADLRFVAGLK